MAGAAGAARAVARVVMEGSAVTAAAAAAAVVAVATSRDPLHKCSTWFPRTNRRRPYSRRKPKCRRRRRSVCTSFRG